MERLTFWVATLHWPTRGYVRWEDWHWGRKPVLVGRADEGLTPADPSDNR